MKPMTEKRAPAAKGGFSLVELVIAVTILAFGVLSMAATTAFVVRQVTLADVNTERAAAYQSAIEQIRATNASTLGAGSQTVGAYSVTWSITDSTTLSKTVRIITQGPGLAKDTSAIIPSVANNVQDTFTILVLKQ
jgi:type II secretory pathway pseudopilin PulG